jgi:integrase
MERRIKFTKTSVNGIKPVAGKQIVYWDTEVTGLGLRVSPGGAKTYFYQGRRNGSVDKESIGRVDKFHLPDEARTEAREIARSFLRGERRIRRPDEDAPTLGKLMLGYVELLESQGKASARNVKNQIKADIEKAHPRLWNKPAAEITLDDCMDIVGSVMDRGKPRQADKLRAYLRTAFSEAINARGDINMPSSLRKMKISYNPARDMRKVRGSSKAKNRALSVAEFRAYWNRVQKLETPQRELAMLHVITGGQRQKQLSRVTWADIDRDGMSMTIWDYKGRRNQPRRHVVPLLPEALELMDAIGGTGDYVFSCDGGKRPINDRYLPDITASICTAMETAGELEGAPFTAGTIRATIETRLMKKPYRVSSDVLGQLLSHGMGGVQQRHYQHDDFEEEKLEALQKLWRLVNNKPEPVAQVIPMQVSA